MTAFNAGGYLRLAVKSLVDQSHGDWELILVDNGSTDRSIETMGIKDSRVRLISLKENIGRTPALKLALDQARHQYVAILDADDMCHRNRLEVQSKFLDNNPQVVLVGSCVEVIDSQSRVTGKLCLKTGLVSHDVLAERNVFVNSSLMYRHEEALAVGGYESQYEYAQDYHLVLKLASRGDLHVIPDLMTYLRVSPTSYTKSNRMQIVRAKDEVALFALAPKVLKLSGNGAQLNKRRQALSNIELALLEMRQRQFRPSFESIRRALSADPRLTWVKYLAQGRPADFL